MIKSKPQNAQRRRILEVYRIRYKDYTDKKKNEREIKRNEREIKRSKRKTKKNRRKIQKHEEIPLNNNQLEVCIIYAKFYCDFKTCLICLHIYHFSYKLIIMIIRYLKNKKKYLYMKSKY